MNMFGSGIICYVHTCKRLKFSRTFVDARIRKLYRTLPLKHRLKISKTAPS